MIAWYVHHHGSGHVTRARTIAAHLQAPVLGLSTRAEPEGWSGRWITLPDDAGVDDPLLADVTGGSTLHWVPRHHDGLRRRMGTISAALADGDVRLMVTDVSVEVAVLARLHGVPVVVMAQPGERTDRAHRSAYDLADLILAPWPARPERPWPAPWAAKTRHLGGISRYDGRPRPEPRAPGSEPVATGPAATGLAAAGPLAGDAVTGPTVLVVWGTGGIDVSRAALADAAAATPGWTWLVAGPAPASGTAPAPANLRDLGWVADLWPWLARADVVVTHAGQNAVAEVAAARRPAVVIPQRRPFGEQEATAEAIARAGIAATVGAWPAGPEWPAVLASAVRIGGARWSGWSTGHGARDAAAEIDALLTPLVAS